MFSHKGAARRLSDGALALCLSPAALMGAGPHPENDQPSMAPVTLAFISYDAVTFIAASQVTDRCLCLVKQRIFLSVMANAVKALKDSCVGRVKGH